MGERGSLSHHGNEYLHRDKAKEEIRNDGRKTTIKGTPLVIYKPYPPPPKEA